MLRKLPIPPEQILAWKAKVEATDRLLHQRHLPTWRKVLAAYRAAEQDDPGLPGIQLDESEDFNFLLSTANAVVPSLLAAQPFLHVRPRRAEDKESARVAEAAINYVWEQMEATPVVRRLALDCLMFGVGFGKVEYDPSGAFLVDEDFETGPEQGPADSAPVDPAWAGVREMLAEAGMESTSPLDKPRVVRVAPWDLLLPAGYVRLSDCPWVAERKVVRLDELRADRRFVVPIDLRPSVHLVAGPPGEGLGIGDDESLYLEHSSIDPEYIEVFEIRYWHRLRGGRSRRRILWLLGDVAGKDIEACVLRHVDDELQMPGYPYVDLRWVDNPADFYATRIADLASIEPIARALNDQWRNLLELHDLNNQIAGKFLTLPGALEGGAISQLVSSAQRGAYQEIAASVARIQDAIMPLPQAPIPGDTSLVLQGLQKMMYEISGVDVFQRGGVGRKGTTATEAAIASAGSQTRASLRLEAIERCIEALAAKALAILRQFWDEPQYIRVLGGDGEYEFRRFDPAEIRGEYDIQIEAGSTLPKDPATEQQAFLGLLQTIGQVLATLAPMVQAGVLPATAIANFVDRAFEVWRQDRPALLGPLSQIQSAALGGGGAGAGPGAGGALPPEAVAGGQGLDPETGGGLAGTGPRPRPGQEHLAGMMGQLGLETAR